MLGDTDDGIPAGHRKGSGCVISTAGKNNQLEYFVNITSNWQKFTPLQVKVNSDKVILLKVKVLQFFLTF